MRTRARLLVVGDSGIGKSCVIHKICAEDAPSSAPDWTVGCQVQVKQVRLEDQGEPFFAELLDVGCHNSYELSRKIYYNNVNGLVLVYDLSNGKSFTNLKRWVQELGKDLELRPAPMSSGVGGNDETIPKRRSGVVHESNGWGGKRIQGLPVLVIGNKADIVKNWTKVPNVYNVFGFESVNMSAITPSSVPGGKEGIDRVDQFIRAIAASNQGVEMSYYNAGGIDF